MTPPSSPETISGPTKGTPFGMCRHVQATPFGDLHWYIDTSRKKRCPVPYDWVCVCPACHDKAQRSPNSPLPVYAVGVLGEDVPIDTQGEN